MASGKEEKKEDKGKEKEEQGKEKEEKKEGNDVINAIYKVNLHCQQCGRKIKKYLLVTQGVQNVETDMEKGEIKVRGKLDPLKILKLIEKTSNKKVELISPKIKLEPPKEKPKEIKKEPIIRTIKAKVHMHCEKCERDLKNRLIKHRGIFSVKIDQEAEIVTIEGSIEPDRLLRFLKRKVHKNAEIISSKEEKKIEDKEKGKKEEKGKAGESSKEKEKEKKKDGDSEEKKKDGDSEKKEKGEEKSIVVASTKEKEIEKKKERGGSETTQIIQIQGKAGESSKEKEKEKKKDSDSEKEEKGEEKSIVVASTKEKEMEKKRERDGSENTQIIQIQEDTKVEIVAKHNVPYIIHYVYAPQIFSDENPNACCVS